MWKKLRLSFRIHSRKQRLCLDTDYEFLKKKLGIDEEEPAIDEAALDALRQGTDVFLGESPASSWEEAMALARQAMREMLPAPWREIPVGILLITVASGDMAGINAFMIAEEFMSRKEYHETFWNTCHCRGQFGVLLVTSERRKRLMRKRKGDGL